MATNENIPPTLGSLDFNEIKNSLIDYLRNQNIIKDYNYEGSVIRTLIDLLAYNTFYYAYYTNMIASEMFLDSAQRVESVVSLVKPLGYTVSGKKSARARVTLTGLLEVPNNIIPKHSIFYAVNNDGISFIFRNLEDVNIADSQCDVDLVECKNFVYDVAAIQSVDLATQKYFIANTDIDISTLKIEVKLQGETDFSTWRLAGNIGSPSDIDQKIYFIERTVNGFVVQFGLENALGISLTANDTLRITYAVSSGTDGNDLFLFRSSQVYGTGNFNLSIVQPSAGGLNEPDLNLIKFLAPKWFSAQDRAVTKNDYVAMIMEAGYANNINDFAVYGGEEVYPPRYGRVFISLNESNQSVIDSLINYLREKSVITIFPEYVQPVNVNVNYKYAIRYDNPNATENQRQQILNSVKSYVQTKYTKTNSFNISLDAATIAEDINTNFLQSKITANANDFEFFTLKIIQPSDGQINLNLQNEIGVNLVDDLQITTAFKNIENRNIILYLKTTYNTNRNRFVNIIGRDASTNVELQGYFGKINIKNGAVEIPAIATTPYTLTLPFAKKYFSSTNNNVVNIFQTGVEIL
jgi:hypothetical protein